MVQDLLCHHSTGGVAHFYSRDGHSNLHPRSSNEKLWVSGIIAPNIYWVISKFLTLGLTYFCQLSYFKTQQYTI